MAQLHDEPHKWASLSFEGVKPSSLVELCLDRIAAFQRMYFANQQTIGPLLLESDIHYYIYESNHYECVGNTFGATKQAIMEINPAQFINFSSDIDTSETAGIRARTLLDECRSLNQDHALKRMQILNHWVALLKMRATTIDDMWSVEGICRLHGVLMEGQNNADSDAPVIPGMIRTTPCMAVGIGGRQVQYAAPELLAGLVAEFAEYVRIKLHESTARGPSPLMFAIAGYVLVRFLEIHPFGDGNGRLTRLLVNHVLWMHGIRFPLVLVVGRHKKAKKHYLQVLDNIQHKQKSLSMASTFIAFMLSDALSVFTDLQIMMTNASSTLGED